jgi:hypothetical protein
LPQVVSFPTGGTVNPDCSTWTPPSLPVTPVPARGGIRSALVAIAGGILLAAGLVGLFLPAPGVALIVMGLSLLGTRYAIARRWLESVQRSVSRLRGVRR